MAPKESETSSAVFSYLSQQNRPYSANDLHLNLHKEHGKTAIQKVVDTMVEEGKLKVKVNGKQTCYFVNQVWGCIESITWYIHLMTGSSTDMQR